MLELEKIRDQAKSVQSKVREVILGDGRGWLYPETSLVRRADTEALQIYQNHFAKLLELRFDSSDRIQHVTHQRFLFIESDVTSTLAYFEVRKDLFEKHPWRYVLLDTLLTSRNQAIAQKDIGFHMTRSEIMKLPSVRNVNIETVTKILNEHIEKGNVVSGDRNRKEKWYAPSVPYIVEWWIDKLSWFSIRGAIIGRGKPHFYELYKDLWVKDLDMPLSIYEYTMSKDWSLYPIPLVESAGQLLPQLRVVD
jgi:hypothetical protein